MADLRGVLPGEDGVQAVDPLDLVVHRQIGQWLKTGKARADETELVALGDPAVSLVGPRGEQGQGRPDDLYVGVLDRFACRRGRLCPPIGAVPGWGR